MDGSSAGRFLTTDTPGFRKNFHDFTTSPYVIADGDAHESIDGANGVYNNASIGAIERRPLQDRSENKTGQGRKRQTAAFKNSKAASCGADDAGMVPWQDHVPTLSTTKSQAKRASPLELEFQRNCFHATCALPTFTSWATGETADSFVNQVIGTVQSIHLFRETGGIHHEFVLIRLGGSDIQPSWLRVERSGHLLKNGTKRDIRALFLGSPLRERVTVGSSKEGLILKPVIELATLSLPCSSSLGEESSLSAMLLEELASHMDIISSSAPVYQLFTYNCRFFARRLILGVAERLHRLTSVPSQVSSSSRMLVINWQGEPCEYGFFRQQVRKEPFGGSKVSGKQGSWMGAKGLVVLADHYLARLHPTEALSISNDAILSLRNHVTSRVGASRQRDFAVALVRQSRILEHLKEFDLALTSAGEALRIARTIWNAQGPKFSAPLAVCLQNISNISLSIVRPSDALPLAQEAVRLYTELLQRQGHFFGAPLAASLATLSRAFRELRRPEDALSSGQEALRTRRELFQKRPDVFRLDLAMSLTDNSVDLRNLGREEEALVFAQEALLHRRELAKLRPHVYQVELASGLLGIATDLRCMKRHEEALTAGLEGVEIRRELYQRSPDVYRAELSNGLNSIALDYRTVGRLQEALDAIQEAVELRRQLYIAQPDIYRVDIAYSLSHISVILSRLKRSSEAIAAGTESVAFYRQLFSSRPESYGSDLARSLDLLAVTLRQGGLFTEAFTATQESVKLRRQLFLLRPTVYCADLAMSLSTMLAVLSDMERLDEALEVGKSVVDMHRQCFAARPDVHRGDLVCSLRRVGEILDQLGDTDAGVAYRLEAEDLMKT